MPQEKLFNPSEPKFKVNDLVYVVVSELGGWGKNLPAIGTPHEIDLKVMSINTHGPGDGVSYNLMSGHGKSYTLPETALIHARDKWSHYPVTKYRLNIDTELAPSGTLFVLIGQYYQNEELGIYIHYERFDKLMAENRTVFTNI